jgi:hypothetical protein
MEQFRQRVAATCHIGPLDAEETRLYIEHRLKCAGYSGAPLFSSAAAEGVFKASGGIPRRINGICDRMMLGGFLNGRKELTIEDLDEVVAELRQENTVPSNTHMATLPAMAGAEPSMPGGLAGSEMDIDLGAIKLTPEQAADMNKQIASLAADQRGDQLQRLERGLLRLERVNLQTLAMLQALVAAVKKPEGGDR